MKVYVVMADGVPDAVYYHRFSAQVSAQWLTNHTDYEVELFECEIMDD